MRNVQARIMVAAPSERALRAFLDLADLRGWWNVERGLVENRPGGVRAPAREASNGGFGFVVTGTIRTLIPGDLPHIDNLVYFNPESPVLGPMQLTVSVSPTDTGTLPGVRRDGYGEGPAWDWYHQAVLGAWSEALELVRKHLETKPENRAATARQ